MRLKFEIISPDNCPREKFLRLQLWPRDLNLSDEIWREMCGEARTRGHDGMQSLSV